MIRILKFETRYKGTEPVDYVLVAPIGEAMERTQTWHRINSIRPSSDPEKKGLSHKDMEAKWSIIGPAYDAWKSGNELPETGTPLAAWAGIDPNQADALKKVGIRSVEEVAKMSDATLGKLNWPDARRLPKVAQEWLAGRGDAKLAEELEQSRERMAAMEEMIAELTKAKPKRGRPPKAEQDEAAA